jgi:hypothetical protein
MEHTPGPWTTHQGLYVYAADKLLAQVFDRNYRHPDLRNAPVPDPIQARDNLRIMAAAGSLYEAAKWILDNWDKNLSDGGAMLSNAVNQAHEEL